MLEISYAGLEEHNLSGVASAVLNLGMRGVNSSRASYLLLARVRYVTSFAAYGADNCARSGTRNAYLAEELGHTTMGARTAGSLVVDAMYTRWMDELL